MLEEENPIGRKRSNAIDLTREKEVEKANQDYQSQKGSESPATEVQSPSTKRVTFQNNNEPSK